MCAKSTEKHRTDFVGDFAKRLVLHDARICARPRNDQLRFVLARQGAHLIEIDQLGYLAGRRTPTCSSEFPRKTNFRSVG